MCMVSAHNAYGLAGEGTVKIWDVNDGQLVATINAESGGKRACQTLRHPLLRQAHAFLAALMDISCLM